VRPIMCRRLRDPDSASLFLTGCGTGLMAAMQIYQAACFVNVRHMARHSQLERNVPALS
jgi:hypothetical protein